jgi:hypothetical protein
MVREADEGAATQCQGVADLGVEAGGERRGPHPVLSPPGDTPANAAVVAVAPDGLESWACAGTASGAGDS